MNTPEIGSYYSYVQASYSGAVWQQQAQVLRQLSDYLKQRNIRLVAVTFPFLHQLNEYAFAPTHQQLQAFWAGEGVPHLDLLPVFLQHKNEDLVVNAYDAHPNERAHALAAEAISTRLSEVLQE